MSELRLVGCRSEPLGSYLKALGALRLVGEQVDPRATGRWVGDVFVLDADLDGDGLAGFLVDRYRPTPLVAPWNGGSGFGPKDQQAGITVIEASSDPRLDAYRRAVAAARGLRADPRWGGWTKEEQVQRCRAWLPDEAVAWIDAAVVLTNDRAAFPPLLGTGGNDGRLEFSNNFMQRLVGALPVDGAGRETGLASVRAALFATPGAKLTAAAVGQFDPGGAGGVNSSATGAAASLVNPWNYVLLLEGALLFASGAARRMGADTAGRAVMPFMVGASPVGYASGAQAEASRGELWAPLWSRAATAGEVARLIGEGRASWGGRQARTGLDFARATADLGTDRGIDSFVRHAFVQRLGLSILAVPVGRVDVRARPQVPVLAQLDPWVNRVRRAESLPDGVAAALRRLDGAQFAVSVRGGAAALQEALVAAAHLETAVSHSTGLREKATQQPLQGLPAGDWLAVLDDGSAEFRLAAAIASQRDPVTASGSTLSPIDRDASSPAVFLRSVRMASPWALEWTGQTPRAPGLGVRPLTDVLADVLTRRAIDVTGRDDREEPLDGQVGVQPTFRHALPAPLADIAAFIDGALDEERVARLLAALLLLDWRRPPGRQVTSHWRAAAGPLRRPAHPAWAVLAPFFHGPPIELGRDKYRLRPDAGWPRALAAGRLREVVEQALLRLRIARLDPAPADAAVMAADLGRGVRLAAALLCPLSPGDAATLLRRVVPAPLDQPSPSEPSTQEAVDA